jgi:hypothetical protein
MFGDFTLPPHKEDTLLRTVRSNRTGTTKTVSLRTYTSPSNPKLDPRFERLKQEVDVVGRDAISKTTFGEHSMKLDPRFERQKPKVDVVVSRNAISKTTFGEHSRLKWRGIDSIEFAKKSKDLVINQVDGKQIKACLRNPGEIDMVRGFFKILRRLY